MPCASEDELCDSIVANLIYLPELISYIAVSRFQKITALSFTLSLQKPPVVPCRRFFVVGQGTDGGLQPRMTRAREFGR